MGGVIASTLKSWILYIYSIMQKLSVCLMTEIIHVAYVLTFAPPWKIFCGRPCTQPSRGSKGELISKDRLQSLGAFAAMQMNRMLHSDF